MGSYSRKRYATESASFPKSENSAPGSYSYATFADLPASGSTPGNTAFVVATNKLYIWSGVGWYLIATVTNASPTAITGVDGAYTLAIDGTATTITAVSTDPEGFSLTWSYAVSSGSLGSTATVSQADNVFTITPSTDTANAGTFSITFSVTDGINGVVSAVSSFTLAFIVQNSRYTALSVKATNTGSNQTFDDASTSNHTITASGDITASTFSPYRHGGYSFYFGPVMASNYIRTNSAHADFAFGTGDFTIEFWIYKNDSGSWRVIVDAGYGGNYSIWSNQSDILEYYVGSSVKTSTTTALLPNIWTHIALVRNSGVSQFYMNGVASGSAVSDTVNYSGTNHFWVPSNYNSNLYSMNGYYSDVRVVKGTAVYTSNFTPPTEPLTAITNTKFLLGQLPYLKDQSTSNHALITAGDVSLKPKSVFDNSLYSEASHGASVYLDGTGDYLTGPSSATIGIGTGDFTIECWFYATDASLDRGIWETRTDGYPNHSEGLSLTRITETTFRVYGTSQLIVSSATIITNNWNHLAVVRNSGTLEFFVNGVSQGTVSNSTNMNSVQPIAIGSGRYTTSNSTPTHAVKGYIQDFRVVKGTAVYTSNFTPPTAPLTNSPTYPAMAIGVANSGANAYTLSGDVTGSNATVNIAIGQTVNFTVNASGHPFYIRVSDGGANVSTPAATGQGATSGVVSWTPNAAGTYYYQCGNHNAMIGTINVAEGVKFLLNPETSILDLSQRNALKCVGDAATSTTQVKFAGTKSIYLDGTGDFLQSSESVNIAGDWTIEGWYYFTTLTGAHSFFTIGDSANISTEIRNSSFEFLLHTTGELRFYNMGGGYSNQHAPPSDFLVNNWIHIAVVRSGTGTNNIRAYINGTQSGTGITANHDLKGIVTVGAEIVNGNGSWFTQGYIQDFRVSSIARYTTTFTPPTAELQG